MHCSICGISMCVMDRLYLLLLPCLPSLGRHRPCSQKSILAAWLLLAGSLVALLGGLASFSGAASSDLIASLLAGRADPGSPHCGYPEGGHSCGMCIHCPATQGCQ